MRVARGRGELDRECPMLNAEVIRNWLVER